MKKSERRADYLALAGSNPDDPMNLSVSILQRPQKETIRLLLR